MLQRWVVLLVDFCWRRAKTVAAGFLLLTLLLGWFAGSHLSLDTDESHMISPHLPFRLTEQAIDRAFPDDANLLVAVIDGPSAERTEAAVAALEKTLAARTDLFTLVHRPPEEVFFRRHGLLFLSTDELSDLSDRLTAAQPMLGELARDPSLRGLLATTNLAIKAAQAGAMDAKDLDSLLDRFDGVAQAIDQGRTIPAAAWQTLLGSLGSRDSARRILLTQPRLRFDSLVAGADAEAAIRAAAAAADFSAQGLTLRLTGPVALSDANFITVTQGASLSVPLILVAMIGLLAWAVRSWRAVVAVLTAMIAGLVATGAFAAATVGVLNPISVAFAVMFVGIAVDFGIQFVVRLQDERTHAADATAAIRSTARVMAMPLTVAGIATSVGFLSFLPTDYTGVSQLGLIAGGGMVIALLVDFTLLPALLALLPSKPRAEALGLPWGPADGWLSRHHRRVLQAALALAAVGVIALPRLPVDFDPLHLQDPKSEAVAVFHDLAKSLDNGVYEVQMLVPDAAAADAIAPKFAALPDVLRTETLKTFVPDDQTDKLAIIADLASQLTPTLSPPSLRPAPDDTELLALIRQTADAIAALPRPDATQRANRLRAIANRGPSAAHALQTALLEGLPGLLDALRQLLVAEPVTLEGLPADLRRDWIAPDGRWRIKILPKTNIEDARARLAFVSDVTAISPDVSGTPISIVRSGQVVSRAFAKAGAAALLAIAVLLWLMLRRIGDFLLVVFPLLLGALYTVLGCELIGLPINFANIIALPLLLGIGVAFNIYFVINWRHGVKNHFQTATSRAVLFSALTTGSAFGSLAVSPHLGTASMGVLLFVSLGLSVVTTFIVLPALFAYLDQRND